MTSGLGYFIPYQDTA